MQITFTAANIDDLRAQMWTFLNGPPAHVAPPAAPVFNPPELFPDSMGRMFPAVPDWAPKQSLWVGSAHGPRLVAPDGSTVPVNWMDLSKPA